MIIKPEELQDDFVGRVYGNILDQFVNPTYNLKLYMLKDPNRPAESVQGNTSDELTRDPSDTVVLAQTGVTGTQIDNLIMRHKISASSGIVTTEVDFAITQPGAADFLDQIQLARAYLGIPLTTTVPLFLEIVFKGYTADTIDDESSDRFDEDAGGEPVTIAGPFRYKLTLRNISMSIDNTGSFYELSTMIENNLAFTDSKFRLPQDITTTGSTISEHVESLKEALNKYHSETATSEIPDEFDFDLSYLVSGETPSGAGTAEDPRQSSQNIIDDESLITSTDFDADDINRVLNETFEIGSAVDKRTELQQNPTDDTGTVTEQVFDVDRLGLTEKTSIYDFFTVLLSMCPEYYSKVTRKADITDPDSEISKDQGTVTWFRINTRVETIGYDKTRKDFARRYIYVPTLYKTARTDVAVDEDEQDVNVEATRRRLREVIDNGMLWKSYKYLFTGENDQILNLDIRYDNGIALLAAPKGGTTGDINITNSAVTAPTVDESQDVTPQGQERDLFDRALDSIKKDLFASFIGSSGLLRPDLLDSLIGNLSDSLGRSADEISNIFADTTGQLAQQFANELDSQTLNEITANININPTPAPPSEPTETTNNTDGEIYTPELSGFAYSADIIDPAQYTVDSETLLQRGYITFDDFQEAVEVTQATNKSEDIPNPTAGATTRSLDPSNRLFGYLVSQHAADQFLVLLNMKLRGDPWYLGGDGIDRSNTERINFNADENTFFLTVKAPIKYDPDWTDEDSELNSGFWKYDGISRTFSGLYTIVGYTTEFSGGQFSIDVEARRERLKVVTAQEPTEQESDEPLVTETGQIIGDDGFVAGSI
jgi:hypothetical protein